MNFIDSYCCYGFYFNRIKYVNHESACVFNVNLTLHNNSFEPEFAFDFTEVLRAGFVNEITYH